MNKFIIQTSYRNLLKLTLATILLAAFVYSFLSNYTLPAKMNMMLIFGNVAVSPELSLFVLPVITLFVGFDITRVIGTGFGDVLQIRLGNKKSLLDGYLFGEFVFALILELAFFLASVFAAIFLGIKPTFVITIKDLMLIWLQVLDIYSWLVLFTLFQLYFKKQIMTFVGGLIFCCCLFAILKVNLPLLHHFAFLPGTELFLNSNSLISLLNNYISVVWIIVEFLMIHVLLLRGDYD
ncbi:hypothetical protein PT281_03785 [Lactobacillus sp. ESL0701]|uniref:hypothetical protein n=1 Tax=Lactobacillus sp. ESL0701 TaxID=2983217 RepID=UPI0023F74EA9|nr:hypothetical protein [Lactobacillus sp. ESL0701]MDF7672384.1 hypothetical protein [Lactobacillus sp. ESL0701]